MKYNKTDWVNKKIQPYKIEIENGILTIFKFFFNYNKKLKLMIFLIIYKQT